MKSQPKSKKPTKKNTKPRSGRVTKSTTKEPRENCKKLTKLDNWLCKLYEPQNDASDAKVKKEVNVESSASSPSVTETKKPKGKVKKSLKQSEVLSDNKNKTQTNKHKEEHKGVTGYVDRSSEYTKLDNKDYKCAKCDFTHSNLISIRSHYDKQHNEKSYKCSQCPFETKQQYYYNSHVKQHAKPDEECPHCKKMIKWFSFKMHIKTHERNDKTEYKCDVCDYRSYNHANVKRHTLTRHKNPHELKTYTCNSCDYVTVLEERLKQHKRVVHSKEGNWLTCPLCDYTTRNKSHMTRHTNDLHKEKSIQCNECSQLFSSKEHLRYHKQRKHSDPSTRTFYYCEMCPKENRYKTTEKGNLARHVLAHRTLDEIEVFACHKCPYLGKSRNALKTHLINAHLPEMHTFKCDLCGYSTGTKSRYKTHVKIVHGEPKGPQTLKDIRAETSAAVETDCDFTGFDDVEIKQEVEEAFS